MNIASVIGLLGGIGCIMFALTQQFEELPGMGWDSYYDAAGIQIVFGGMVAALFLKASPAELRGFLPSFFTLFRNKNEKPTDLIAQLVDLATIARKDGVIALESQEINNIFMAKGIRMLVDGSQGQAIKQTLTADLLAMKLRHKHSISVFAYLGEVAPAMGMIGTLVGLVGLLNNMSDVALLGTAMATAVLTTLYGAFMANAFFLPAANKLGVQSESEVLNKEIIMQAIFFMQAGGNPRVLEEQLSSYLAPRIRTSA